MIGMMKRLRRDTSGVAMTEFALAFPFILGVGLMGLETANRALIEMQVSQLAVQIADNGSRIGEHDVLEDRKIYEDDINDLFYGAHIQSGKGVDIFTHGRVIMSSLQFDKDTAGQYIHWQRCVGNLVHQSSYGDETTPQGDLATGMGPSDAKVMAFEEAAVIFVEVAYTYQPLIGDPFTFGEQDVRAIASFIVRDDRDLTGIYQRDAYDPDPVADCDEYGGSVHATETPTGTSSTSSTSTTSSSGGTTTSGGSTTTTSGGSTTTSGGTTTSTSSGTTTSGGSTTTSGGSSGGGGGASSSGGATSSGANSSGGHPVRP